jgi:hypothetical protein
MRVSHKKAQKAQTIIVFSYVTSVPFVAKAETQQILLP